MKIELTEKESDQYRFLQGKGTFQTGGDEILREHC
jgi:hypothetical protein